MRIPKENLIELLDATKQDNICSALIACVIDGQRLNLRFAISLQDFGHLRRILEFRPFENTGVGPYRYFFTLSYTASIKEDPLILASIRVEQLNKSKHFSHTISKKLMANLFWFESLENTQPVELMIE